MKHSLHDVLQFSVDAGHALIDTPPAVKAGQTTVAGGWIVQTFGSGPDAFTNIVAALGLIVTIIGVVLNVRERRRQNRIAEARLKFETGIDLTKNAK